MSHPSHSTSSSPNFQLIFDNSLNAYKKRTKNDLLTHPLVAQLQDCKSHSAILAVIHEQFQQFHQSRESDERLTKWLDPTVKVLYSLSGTLGESVSLVFSPAKVIFAGVQVLLSAAMDVRASQDTLIDIFERMENFFQRLEIYTNVPQTPEMMDMIVKSMVEVLSTLGIATKEMKQSRTRKYLKKLIGRTDIEDALKRLEKLGNEEVRMVTAQGLKATHAVDDRVGVVESEVLNVEKKVAGVDDRVAHVDDRVAGVNDRVAGVDDRVSRVDDRVVGVDDRVAHVDERVAVVDDRVSRVDDRVAGVDDRVAHVNERVVGVNDRVAGVDQRVARVDDRVLSVGDSVACVDERVATVNDSVNAIHDKVAVVIDEGKETRAVIQQVADDMDQVKRNQLRQDLRRWLSPPDPSINHNIACAAHRKQTADWFFKGTIFTEWKSDGPLLWLHGKPGSGKSILCSTIIQDIVALRDNRLASMAYFYFDFRDINKQNRRDLLPSLVTQLSDQSHRHCDILNDLYLKHGSGAQKPSEDVLIECLKDMVTLPDQHPVYLIIDALDECPDTSGLRSPREQVLDLLNTLVELSSPNLRLCVTSRPEIDIRHALEPLTSLRVSLHEESGQRRDIIDYVTSVVQSDPKMRRWRDEDRKFVIETLSEKADGMFRYAFCQLEALRYCFPQSVRHMVEELPKTLDETYERILRGINKTIRDHAHRLLQCLTVAVRPLRVAELAEVLAVDFGTASRGETSKLNTDWRWEDEQEAVLSTCSSLISVVDEEGSQVVQFSHFSVKEFLISSRIGGSSADVSAFHILLESAHTVLAKACLGILVRLGEHVDNDSVEDDVEDSSEYSAEDNVEDKSPLARYAAKHWVDHARFGNVLSHIREGMEDLFDPDKPYFAAWLQIHNIDTKPPDSSVLYYFALKKDPNMATPLYYAALCGFHDLTEQLIIKHPLQVNAAGGHYVSPLAAALSRGHFEIAQLLYERSADVDVQGRSNCTPLDGASCSGQLDIVQWLLSRGANPNVLDRSGWTPLHSAAYFGHTEVSRLLLQYQANINARDNLGKSPLHYASEGERVNVARLLLEHGADVNAQDNSGDTSLHLAACYAPLDVARVLVEHGANIDAEDDEGRTAFQVATERGRHKIAKFLSDHGSK